LAAGRERVGLRQGLILWFEGARGLPTVWKGEGRRLARKKKTMKAAETRKNSQSEGSDKSFARKTLGRKKKFSLRTSIRKRKGNR